MNFKSLIDEISCESPNMNTLLYFYLKFCSADQLDEVVSAIISSFERMDSSSRETNTHLWEHWSRIYDIHPFPYRLFTSTLRSLQTPIDSSFAPKIFSISQLFDEPTLVFRMPKVLFTCYFSLNVLLLALKEGLLCCRVRCGEETARRSKLRRDAPKSFSSEAISESDASMFLSVQDHMVARLLLEVVDGETDSGLKAISPVISKFFSWLLNYREASSLARVLLLQGNARGLMLVSDRYVSFTSIITALESILTSTVFELSSQDFISVLLSIETLFQRWKLHPHMLAIANLLPAFICRAYGSFSVFMDLSETDEAVIRVLDTLEVHYPASLMKVIAGCSKLQEASLSKKVSSRASELYEEHRKRCYQMVLSGGPPTSSADTVPPPL